MGIAGNHNRVFNEQRPIGGSHALVVKVSSIAGSTKGHGGGSEIVIDHNLASCTRRTDGQVVLEFSVLINGYAVTTALAAYNNIPEPILKLVQLAGLQGQRSFMIFIATNGDTL